MSGKAHSHTERLERILDYLGDHIRGAPGDDLLDAAREEGRDPGEVNSRIKNLLLRSFKSHQQKALAEAKEGYKRESASISEGHFDFPKTPEGRRSWFVAALAQAPQLEPAFTMQHRDLSELSDEDIESHLRKLAQLGVLQSVRLPEEK
jgi:hypothetical protein